MIDRTHGCLAIGLIAALVLTGCTTAPTDPNAPAPAKLELQMRAKTTTGRYTYFELADNSELSFGGGQAAAQRIATPVVSLTPPQREKVWRIIQDYRLLEAKSAMLGQAEKVSYELEINTGGLGRSIRAVDDRVPGLKELHDYLFELQAAVRYKIPALEHPREKP